MIETCLKINCKQSVKLRRRLFKFKSHFKQSVVLFKVDADFKSILKGVRGSDRKIMLHTLKNIKHIFLAVLLTKLFVLMINILN